ncbi:DUF192 domain-containing protein [bacterium]|nr:DUF192 domain-containing protein [bacterium]
MIQNLSTHKEYKIHVYRASSLLSRLLGLLGTNAPVLNSALHIQPCHAIHTFGMKYSIDVLFLDQNGCIVGVFEKLKPNAVSKSVKEAVSVLELAPGTIEQCQFRTGQFLRFQADDEFRPELASLRNLFHWPINLIIALFWSKFILTAGGHAVAFPHAMNFGILIHNTLLMLLFLTRRKSHATSFKIFDWIVPVLTLIFTLFLRPASEGAGELNVLSAIFQYLGLAGIIVSLLSLGRSFGIIPANRSIQTQGAYGIVRHPLYISEIIFHAGFFLGNITVHNGLLIVLILAGQLWRSISEERLLTLDAAYRAYSERVRYRFIPGIV